MIIKGSQLRITLLFLATFLGANVAQVVAQLLLPLDGLIAYLIKELESSEGNKVSASCF